ncbi:transposase [Nannocystaceae bacterium ST9]
MRDLVDVHYPDAERIRVVLDNLSTHRLKNLYEAFPAAEARRIIKRLEFHHTPKHASWLNMVEIGDLGTQEPVSVWKDPQTRTRWMSRPPRGVSAAIRLGIASNGCSGSKMPDANSAAPTRSRPWRSSTPRPDQPVKTPVSRY